MIVWVWIVIIVLCFIRFQRFLSNYANPYKLYMIFGKKGSGKTTLLTKLAMNYVAKGYVVYSTVDVPGCRTFKAEDVGDFVFPEGAVIFFDEVGIIWDNRNFKNFRSEVRDYFKYQRQYKNTVYLFSQTFDIDLKLRNLTDAMYLCRNVGGIFSVARRIVRDVTLTEATDEKGSQIADTLSFVPWLSILFGQKPALITFIPRYAPYFNSFAPPLRPLIFSENHPPADDFRAENILYFCAICTKTIRKYCVLLTNIIKPIISNINDLSFTYVMSIYYL